MNIKDIIVLITFITTNCLASQDQAQLSQKEDEQPISHNNLRTKAVNVEDMAFAINVHGVIRNGVTDPYKSYNHTLDDFDNPTGVAEHTRSNLRPYGMAWNQAMTKLYGVSRNEEREGYLISIDPSTGVSTEIAKVSGVLVNESIHGIAIDENDQCFVVSTDNVMHDTKSTLYRCNLSTALLTPIGSQTEAPDIHDIAASCDGKIYGTDSTNNKLFTLSKTSGNATLIGPLDLYEGGGYLNMTFNRNTGELFQYFTDDSFFRTAFAKLNKSTGNGTAVSEFFNFGLFVGAIKSSCADQIESIDINPGFNGSWFNPDTSGQGFFLDVLKESNTFFLSWFTYENMVVDTATTSNIGNPGHRWLTAQGELGEGNSVSLTIYNTSGGLFNDPASVESNEVGTMTVEFTDCSTGVINFEFNDSTLSGVIPIQRIANDNVALCESLSE